MQRAEDKPADIGRHARLLADRAYARLNDRIFSGALPPALQIRIAILREAWGSCTAFLDPISGDPKISSIELSRDLFCPHLPREVALPALETILAHEMVHAWQWLVDGERRIEIGKVPLLSHGPSFWLWRPKIQEYGLSLKRGYRESDLFGDVLDRQQTAA